jgi:VWFA-related protein
MLWAVLEAGQERAREQPQATFRSDIETVAIYATVRDRNGSLVTNLTRDDFRVFVDGRLVEIDTFSNEPEPIVVALLLATRNYRLARLREFGSAFIDALGPADRAVIGSFGHEYWLSPILTIEHQVLHRVLDEALWPGDGYLVGTMVHLAMSALQRERGRRVLLVVGPRASDDCWRYAGIGIPCMQEGPARKQASDSGYMIYGVEVAPQVRPLRGEPLRGSVERMADETGGGYVRLEDDAEVAGVCAQIVEELRHQYVIGFTPQFRDNRAHELRVRANRTGLSVRARRTFRAGAVR